MAPHLSFPPDRRSPLRPQPAKASRTSPDPEPGLTPAQSDALHRVYTLILSFSRPEGAP